MYISPPHHHHYRAVTGRTTATTTTTIVSLSTASLSPLLSLLLSFLLLSLPPSVTLPSSFSLRPSSLSPNLSLGLHLFLSISPLFLSHITTHPSFLTFGNTHHRQAPLSLRRWPHLQHAPPITPTNHKPIHLQHPVHINQAKNSIQHPIHINQAKSLINGGCCGQKRGDEGMAGVAEVGEMREMECGDWRGRGGGAEMDTGERGRL